MRLSSRALQAVEPNPALVDDLVWSYVLWREACDDVLITYDAWCDSVAVEKNWSFHVYRASLDREQAAAAAYAASLGSVLADPCWAVHFRAPARGSERARPA